MKYRLLSLLFIIFLLFVGYFVYASTFNHRSALQKFSFKLGLDLAGGTELLYKADVSKIPPSETSNSMAVLRDVIERRVNIFGVTEPVVQVEEAGFLSGSAEHRLIVELPGVTDVTKAIELIGATPTLEFKLVKETDENLLNSTTTAAPEIFTPTELTGRYLEKAQLEFDSQTAEPLVSLVFNKEGKELFSKITKENIGKILGIFLDGNPISMPVIKEEIREGKAQIQGSFTPKEAKELVRNLNYGALPVPIELEGTQSVGASLGQGALRAGVKAGFWGFAAVALFLVFWYRLPGLVAVVALGMYTLISFAIFKLIPVTLTSAGVAGFILSIGIAVDANVLIFERMKEELRQGRTIADAAKEGFKRAWLSIRDSNISSIITAVVLFWLGTSAVKGFALTFGIGVFISMFTAISVSRTFLFAIVPRSEGKVSRFLFSGGLHIKN